MKQKYTTYKSSEVLTFKEVPSHWNKNRIKYIGFMYGGLTGKSGDDFRKDEDDPTNKPFIPFTNICNNTYIKRDDLKLVSINEGDKQNRVEKDDLFFMMTSETQEDVGKTSVLKDDLGEVYLNTFCKGYRITNKSVNPYFLNYLLNGRPYREILSIEGNGFTRINLRQDRVNDFVVFTPPIPEQEQIVKYLDEKTSQIDSLVSITEKKIELLKQKRTSLINEVVTKGLNPDVELKDSGVEWIGKIPKHWKKIPLKHISYMKGRIGWKGLKQEEFSDDLNLPYLVTGHDIKNDRINWEKCYHISEERYEESPEIKLEINDLLFTKDGTIGKTLFIDFLPGKTSLNSHLLLIRPINNSYQSKFLQYVFKSDYFLSYVELTKTGTTFYGVSQETMMGFNGYFPPLPEQEQIVEHIDTHTTEINNLISIEQRRIETLREYRQSLISEVVTGKIRIFY
jgi:type I restriction enzyme S subunit